MMLTIDRGLEVPVYEQVADQVRRLVASGEQRVRHLMNSLAPIIREVLCYGTW